MHMKRKQNVYIYLLKTQQQRPIDGTNEQLKTFFTNSKKNRLLDLRVVLSLSFMHFIWTIEQLT